MTDYTKGDARELNHALGSTRLIGITGLAGSGKDTAAEALVAAGWKRDAFADRMRAAMLALDPMVSFSMYDQSALRLSALIDEQGWDQAKRNFPEVRRLLQKFGTEAGRNVHGEDCWVNALFRDGWRATSSGGLVITDVRFDNEAEAVRARGGIVVEIIRPGLEPLPGGHASEAGVSPALLNATILNDGPAAQLHRDIRLVAFEAFA